MPSKDAQLEDDILVSRDKIIEMFDPPPGRSTFFDLRYRDYSLIEWIGT